MADPAPPDPDDDAAVVWGRRVGRTLAVAAALALAVWFYITYVRA